MSTQEIWFFTGSQHLYGPEVLDQVAAHSAAIADVLDASAEVPVTVVLKSVLTETDSIRRLRGATVLTEKPRETAQFLQSHFGYREIAAVIERSEAAFHAISIITARVGPKHDRRAGVYVSASDYDFIAFARREGAGSWRSGAAVGENEHS